MSNAILDTIPKYSQGSMTHDNFHCSRTMSSCKKYSLCAFVRLCILEKQRKLLALPTHEKSVASKTYR